jgi:DNA-binding transcriptional LysR family regulator
MDELVFTGAKREIHVQLRPALHSNDGRALMAAARHGIGLVVAPSFLAHDDLEAGRLQPVLLDWMLPEYRVFAVYPHRRFVSPKVRVVIEALSARFGDGTRDPWWPDTPPKARTTTPATRRRARVPGGGDMAGETAAG